MAYITPTKSYLKENSVNYQDGVLGEQERLCVEVYSLAAVYARRLSVDYIAAEKSVLEAAVATFDGLHPADLVDKKLLCLKQGYVNLDTYFELSEALTLTQLLQNFRTYKWDLLSDDDLRRIEVWFLAKLHTYRGDVGTIDDSLETFATDRAVAPLKDMTPHDKYALYVYLLALTYKTDSFGSGESGLSTWPISPETALGVAKIATGDMSLSDLRAVETWIHHRNGVANSLTLQVGDRGAIRTMVARYGDYDDNMLRKMKDYLWRKTCHWIIDP